MPPVSQVSSQIHQYELAILKIAIKAQPIVKGMSMSTVDIYWISMNF